MIIAWEKFHKIPNIVRVLDDDLFIPGIYVATEKLDGANTLAQRTENGFILCSRSNVIAFYDEENPHKSEIVNSFNGFVTYMFNRAENILQLPVDAQMFGEWLIPHTLQYPPEMFGHFYAFNPHYAKITSMFTVPVVATVDVSDVDLSDKDSVDTMLKMLTQIPIDYAEKIGRRVEGVVIAPQNVKDNGERIKIYAPDFKEAHKKAWNPKKIEELDGAAAGYYPVRAYQKIIEKIEDILGRRVRIEDTAQVVGRCSNDYFQEYFPLAIKGMRYPTLNTRKVKSAVEQRVRELFLTQMKTGALPIYAQQELRMEEIKGQRKGN